MFLIHFPTKNGVGMGGRKCLKVLTILRKESYCGSATRQGNIPCVQNIKAETLSDGIRPEKHPKPKIFYRSVSPYYGLAGDKGCQVGGNTNGLHMFF